MQNTFSDWVTKLKGNPQQEQAFLRNDRTVVIAGPGSGKTRVLSLKMAQLLRDEIVPPQGIACLTYTRMMASELISRLHILGVDYNRPNIVVATVHSFCLQEVVLPFRQAFNDNLPDVIRIAPEEVRRECLAKAYSTVFAKAYDGKKDKNFRKKFSKLRRQRIDLEFSKWKDQQDIAQITELYESCLFEQGFVDFDVITRAALSLIKKQPVVRNSLWAKYPWIAVDEYQDLGYPLYKIILELIDRTLIKLFAIGDPDQSIFDFAGTDPKYLHQLSKRPDVQPIIRLEQNYRTAYELVAVAQTVIQESRKYHSDSCGGRCLVWECPDGSPQQENLVVEIVNEYLRRGVSPCDIAVLTRWRKEINSIADCLRTANINFIRDKHPLYDRSTIIIRWLEDVAYWCQKGCFTYPTVDEEERTTFHDLFSRWASFQNTGLDNQLNFENQRTHFFQCLWKYRHTNLSLSDWLLQLTQDLSLDSIFSDYEKLFPDDVKEYRELKHLVQNGEALSEMSLAGFAQSSSGVQLTTIHSSKGTEFRIVIIAGVERIEETKNGRRLLYVGATRAKRRLHLLYTKNTSWSRYPILPKYIKEIRGKFLKGNRKEVSFHDAQTFLDR